MKRPSRNHTIKIAVPDDLAEETQKETEPIEDKKAEAIRRMKAWGIFPKTIEQFEQEGLISESTPPFGACYWLDEDQLKRVRKFEETYNALVYHVIHTYSDAGEMENFLFVSDHPEEWELDHADIANGRQVVFLYNKDEPHYSEVGSIGIARTPAAGLRRIW